MVRTGIITMTEGTPIITETGHCIITPMSTRITTTMAMDMLTPMMKAMPMAIVTTNLRPVTGTTKRLPRRMSPTVTDRSPPFLRPASMCATIAASRIHPLSTA